MSDKSEQADPIEEADAIDFEANDTVDSEAQAQVADEELDPIAKLEAERDDLKDQLLKSMADYQNLARRTSQTIDNVRDESVSKFAGKLITVLDTFDRALALDPDATDAKTVLDGVQSIADDLVKTLSDVGIARVDVEPGDAFDPTFHQALMRQPHDEIESGNIVMQLQPGYTINGKSIRPVQVAVAE